MICLEALLIQYYTIAELVQHMRTKRAQKLSVTNQVRQNLILSNYLTIMNNKHP